jgi:hypothetical protein
MQIMKLFILFIEELLSWIFVYICRFKYMKQIYHADFYVGCSDLPEATEEGA